MNANPMLFLIDYVFFWGGNRKIDLAFQQSLCFGFLSKGSIYYNTEQW